MNSPDNLQPSAPFCWFHGVVEDVADPLQLGRVRVRAWGYHTANLSDIPTSTLPWAIVLSGPEAAMCGVGEGPCRFVPGTWVVGFFRDGSSAQDPIIIGSIPSISAGAIDTSKGFADPAGSNPSAPATPDIPIEATSNYTSSAAYTARAASPTLSGQPSVDSRVGTVYPYNRVLKTKAGHVVEVDDTPGAERINIQHVSGSFIEIDAAGNMHVYTAGDYYHKVAGRYRLSATRIDLN